jgi:23S rRNA pseudouridine1911/1915/1917 synthase
VKITADEAGRVDKVLARQFPGAGRRALAELFDAGAVRVRGKRAKKGDRVAVGDEIELAHAPPTGEALRALPDASVVLDVLVERSDLVAIAKPAGVPSQPLRAGELATNANGVVARWPECAAVGGAGSERDGGLVHRLDIGTSGVLVAARTEAAYRALREAFHTGAVAKDYLAICDGRPVSRDSDAPLAQRGDHVRVDYSDGLPAETTFTVEHATAKHALVRCRARTGRMHQVRAHLAHVAAPIAGDALYGGAPVPGHDGFFLHGSSLALTIGGEALTITAPVPARFASVAELLELALQGR